MSRDGQVTSADGLGILTHVVGKPLPAGWEALPYGDANCDGLVNAVDALLVLHYIVGLDVSAYCIGQPFEADLSVWKSVSDEMPYEGDPVTFTLVVENLGPDTARDVRVQDEASGGLTLDSVRVTAGVLDTLSGLWAVPAIAPGSSDTAWLHARIDSGTVADTLWNMAFRVDTGQVVDPEPANDTALVTLVVDQKTVDLVLDKTVDDASPLEGDTITYAVTVTNLGPFSATGVTVTDTLAALLGYAGSTATKGSYDAGTHVWTLGDIAAGAADTLLLFARVEAGAALGTQVNRARLGPLAAELETDPSNDADSVSIGVLGVDLEVAKSTTNTTPSEGEDFEYVVVLRNVGSLEADGVAVTDTLPTGINYLTYSSTRGTYTGSTGIWDLGNNYAVGDADTLYITVEPSGGTLGSVLENIAEVTGATPADANPTNDADTVATNVGGADLFAVAKTSTNATPSEGEDFEYHVVIRNVGPSRLDNVQVLDTLPPEIRYITYSSSRGTYTSSTGLWDIGNNLAIGDTAWLHITVDPAPGTLGASVDNIAWGSVAQSDTVALNNSDTATVVVDGDDMFEMEKTSTNPTPSEGEDFEYHVVIRNVGPSRLDNVQVLDTLPPEIRYITYSSSRGTYTSSTGLWDIGNNLAIGDTAWLNISVDPAPGTLGATVDNIAWGSAAQSDTVALNNSGTATVVVDGDDMFEVEKTVTNAAPMEEEAFEYQVVIRNVGPSQLDGVQVLDTLPTGIAYQTFTSSRGTYTSSTGLWDIGNNLAIGDTAWLHITVEPEIGTSGQALDNIAVGSAAQSDTVSGNNSATATVDVAPRVDLALSKTVDDPAPNEQQLVYFTLQLVNAGPNDATGVSVFDSLPQGVTYDAHDVGIYDESTGIWDVGSLAAGDTVLITIAATVEAGTGASTITNHASVAAVNEADDDPANDADSVSIGINVVPMDRSFTTAGNTQLVGGAYAAPATPHVAVADNLITGTPSLSVTAGSFATARGGTVDIEADGDFLYTPVAGSSVADTFTYTVTGTQTAEVAIDFPELVWYVDDSVMPGGSGLSNDPMDGIVLAADSSNSSPGDYVFVDAGDGPYSEDVELFSGRRLYGAQSTDLVIPGVGTIENTAGPRPQFFATGNTEDGGIAIRGGDVELVSFDIDGNGYEAIRADGVDLGTSVFDQLSVTNADLALDLFGTTGTLQVTNTSFSGNVNGVALDEGSPTLTFDGDISSIDPSGDLLSIVTTTGGSATFTTGPFTAVASSGVRISSAASDLTIDSLDVQAGTDRGVFIESSTGTYTFNGMHIEGTDSVAFDVYLGSPTVIVDVATGTMVNSSHNVLRFRSMTSGSVNFSGGTITDTGGGGILISSTDAPITISNVVTITDPQSSAAALDVSDATELVEFGDLNIVADDIGGILVENSVVTIDDGTLEVTDNFGMSVSSSTFNSSLSSATVVNNVNSGYDSRAIYFSGTDGTKSFGLLDIESTGSYSTLSAYEAGTIEVTNPASRIVNNGGTAMGFSWEGTPTDVDIVLDELSAPDYSATSSNGLSLSGVSGTLTASTGSLAGSGFGAAVYVSAGETLVLDLSYGGSIAASGSSGAVSLFDMAGGSATFSGSVSSTGDGVSIDNNVNTTVAFTGGLDLSTGANDAFHVADNPGSEVTVTGSGNTIATTTGTPLSIWNTDIGAAGVTFESISVNGADTGLSLSETGGGPFTVTGTGSASTGGTVSVTSFADGAYFSGTGPVELNWMQIQTAAVGIGVSASETQGVTINDSEFLNNDTDVFIDILQYGDVALDGNTMSNAVYNAVDLSNGESSSTGSWTFDFLDNQVSNAGGWGLFVSSSSGTGALSMNVFGNTFDDNVSGGLKVSAGSAQTIDATVGSPTSGEENTFLNAGIGIWMEVDDDDAPGDLTFTLDSNELTDLGGFGIVLSSPATATSGTVMRGTIVNNIVDGSSIDWGIDAEFEGAPQVYLDIEDNLMGGTSPLAHSDVGNAGVFISAGVSDGTPDAPDVHATVLDNSVIMDSYYSGDALAIESWDAAAICVNASGNQLDAPENQGFDGIRVESNSTELFLLQGFTDDGSVEGDVESFLDSVNTLLFGSVVTAIISGANFGAGTCILP